MKMDRNKRNKVSLWGKKLLKVGKNDQHDRKKRLIHPKKMTKQLREGILKKSLCDKFLFCSLLKCHYFTLEPAHIPCCHSSLYII